MGRTVTHVEVHDIRFPTSEQLDGSDALNPDPDYPAAYLVLRTDGGGGRRDGEARGPEESDPGEGHGFCFTIGRGNDVMAVAIESLGTALVGRPAPVTAAGLAALYRELTHDSPLRRLRPERG